MKVSGSQSMKPLPFGRGTRRIYSLLAAFTVVTVIFSAYLTWKIQKNEHESLRLYEQLSVRLGRVGALERAVDEVALPANEIFADGDVTAERAQLDAALSHFRKRLERTRRVFHDDAKTLAEVDHVNDAITPVIEGSEEVFRLFEAGHVAQAAAENAKMRRGYSGVKKEIEDIRVRLRHRRLENELAQHERAHNLEAAETASLALMGLLVIGLFAYGHRLDREGLASREREEELAQKQKLLSEAQHIAEMGAWELDIRSGRLWWSDELYALIGLDPKVVAPSRDVFMNMVVPADRERARAIPDQALAERSRYTHEYRIVRPDGRERVIRGVGRVDVDEEGNPLRMLGVIQDITERKKAEADLRLSEERFKMAARATNDVIWDWDLITGSFTRSRTENDGPAATFAQPFSADLEATLRSRGVHPEDVERIGASLRETLKGSASVWNCEYRFLDSKGVFREVLDRASILRDDSGKAIRVVGAMADISERRAVDRMKDEFISTVSHELRTPLTSIRGALGLLSSGRMGRLEEKGQRLLEIAATNTDRLVRLINDILDIERIESGKVTLAKVSCDAAELTRQAADVVRGLADRENISITVDADPARLFADPDRIVQTLTNLLGNAVKFSPKQSTVHLAAKLDGPNVVFSVSDHGRGIPADKLATIFERFQQVDASDSREKGGSGLGLAICRSIARQHGGDIRVESESGKGSTFFLTIPAGVAEVEAPSQVSAPARIVYVCDDDSASRDVMNFFLTERGYRVREMTSGQELLHAVAEHKPDAILLDLFMPDMNGWETLARLKSDPETSHVPVVVVSVLSPDETGSTGLDLSGWVQKPLDEKDLTGVVARAFSGHRKPRLLLVEDDNDLAATIIASLDRHGIETIHARTGKEAIAMARTVEPDLLILDLVLPDLDGYAVVDWLKDHEVWRGLPLVVYSATEPSPSQRDRLRLGHTEFMTKSRIAPEEFEKRIVTLLDSLIGKDGGPVPHVA